MTKRKTSYITTIIYPAELEAWQLFFGRNVRCPSTDRDIGAECAEAGNRVIALADMIKASRRGELR